MKHLRQQSLTSHLFSIHHTIGFHHQRSGQGYDHSQHTFYCFPKENRSSFFFFFGYHVVCTPYTTVHVPPFFLCPLKLCGHTTTKKYPSQREQKGPRSHLMMKGRISGSTR